MNRTQLLISFGLAGLLAGCPATTTPRTGASTAADAGAEPDPGPCLPIPRLPEEPVVIGFEALEGRTLSFCRLEDDQEHAHCWGMSIDDGRLSELEPRPSPAVDYSDGLVRELGGGLRLEQHRGYVELCPPSGACRRFEPAGSQGAEYGYTRAELSPDRETLAVTAIGSEHATTELWRVDPPERIGSFQLTDEDGPCGEVFWLGNDRLFLALDVCAGPGGWGYIATRDGKRLAPVGGGMLFGTYGIRPVHVAGDRWAFADNTGEGIAIHDVKTGAEVKRLETASAFPRDEDDIVYQDPDAGRLFRSDRGELVYLLAAYGTGTVLVFDPDQAKPLRQLEPRRCPR